jgi:hypothetical protein
MSFARPAGTLLVASFYAHIVFWLSHPVDGDVYYAYRTEPRDRTKLEELIYRGLDRREAVDVATKASEEALAARKSSKEQADV